MIREKLFNSLADLDKYIKNYKIAPNQVISINRVQQEFTNYLTMFWWDNDDRGATETTLKVQDF